MESLVPVCMTYYTTESNPCYYVNKIDPESLEYFHWYMGNSNHISKMSQLNLWYSNAKQLRTIRFDDVIVSRI